MSQDGQDSHPLARRWGVLNVNKGLPMYLVLERKPDNSVGEIQNLADVASGIMLRFKIGKSAKEEKAIAAATTTDDDDADDNKGQKGTRVLLELTELWYHSGHLVTANAYFSSVEAALKMKEKGLRTSSSAAIGSQLKFLVI